MRAPWCQGGANRCAGRCKGAAKDQQAGQVVPLPPSQELAATSHSAPGRNPPSQQWGGIVPRSVLTLGAQVGSEEPPRGCHRDPITRSMDLKDRLPPDLHWRTFLCFSGLLWFKRAGIASSTNNASSWCRLRLCASQKGYLTENILIESGSRSRRLSTLLVMSALSFIPSLHQSWM